MRPLSPPCLINSDQHPKVFKAETDIEDVTTIVLSLPKEVMKSVDLGFTFRTRAGLARAKANGKKLGVLRRQHRRIEYTYLPASRPVVPVSAVSRDYGISSGAPKNSSGYIPALTCSRTVVLKIDWCRRIHSKSRSDSLVLS